MLVILLLISNIYIIYSNNEKIDIQNIYKEYLKKSIQNSFELEQDYSLIENDYDQLENNYNQLVEEYNNLLDSIEEDFDSLDPKTPSIIH